MSGTHTIPLPGPPAGEITYSSAIQATVTVSSSAGNVSLPSVVIPANPIPANTSIHRVTAYCWFRKIVNSNGSGNAVNVEQNIQVRADTPGTYIDAITIADNALSVAASSTEGGTMLAGTIDVKGEVDGADTYELQWEAADVDGNSMVFHDWQCHLKIEYR